MSEKNEAAPVAQGLTDAKRIADVLLAAWQKAEPKHSISQYPESYKETFLDMARALVAHAASPADQGEDAREPVARFKTSADLLDAPTLHTQVYVAATMLHGWPNEAAWDAAQTAEREYGKGACRDVETLDAVLVEVLRADGNAAMSASKEGA